MKKMKTPKQPSVYEILDAMQAAIERGDEKEALYWAIQLLPHESVKLWDGIETTTSEDVGLANPALPATIRALRKQYEGTAQQGIENSYIFVANAILQLCRSPKSRTVVSDLSSLLVNASSGALKYEIPEEIASANKSLYWKYSDVRRQAG